MKPHKQTKIPDVSVLLHLNIGSVRSTAVLVTYTDSLTACEQWSISIKLSFKALLEPVPNAGYSHGSANVCVIFGGWSARAYGAH
jgi:hypothetical protein